MSTPNKPLPPRDLLAASTKNVIKRYDSKADWKSEATVLTNSAFGGLVGWINQTCFAEGPRSFIFTDGMNLREFLDQAYRAA